MAFILIVCLLILYALWDVNYFLRCIVTLGYGTFFQSKAKILDETCIYGESPLPQLNSGDHKLPFLSPRPLHHQRRGHLHPAHEQRAVFAGTGLRPFPLLRPNGTLQWGEEERRGSSARRLQHSLQEDHSHFHALQDRVEGEWLGQEIFLRLNSGFVPFQLIWWDEKAIYIEQQFVSLGDNFVRAIATSKQSLTKVNVVEMMKKFPGGETRPECPKELRLWLDSIELSSEKLRKDK